MSLNSGGHLTHGAKPTFSGKYFNVIQYEVNPETFLIDYDKLQEQALEFKPRMIIAGASAYPRIIDFKRFRQIVDKVNEELKNNVSKESEEFEHKKCYLVVDMAHIAGLVATKLHPSPFPFADVVTSTTHKTLRGTRGGIILTNSEKLIQKINKAVFPGIQGGPLEHLIAAKAVCFGEALKPEFKDYQEQVIKNAKVLADTLINNGFNLVTGGTDNHLVLLDLRNSAITGLELEQRLHSVGITTNKNAIPFDTEKKTITSGVRLGVPALTTRGMKEEQMKNIADLITDVAFHYEDSKDYVKAKVKSLCESFPLDRV